ncbi:CPBP family intramembrane glutamic endopeptidase [Halobacterium litoreum]|uniref:CPBP family intramembrane glutamic endopeptidase n=1 Tax=Halobacterium litoreum TaxID=2039234 RepID=A0ABD5NGL0_9EURY|nr:CPBP family intramembrane glutamic endopeptidase [Halobacterium litoreum]UHH12690.1 CPBP family intramembrane metalloprotease [Halobacterium litoreum]
MSSVLSKGSRSRAVLAAFGIALLGFVLALPAGLVVANAYVALTGNELGDVAVLGVSMISLQGVAFPLAAWLYIRYRGLSWEYVPFDVPDLSDAKYLFGGWILAFVAANVFAQILIAVLSTEPAANTGATTALQNPGIIPYLAVLQILLIGPGEELLFRGVIQKRLREQFSAWPAILLASATFAPAHILALSGGPVAAAITISVLFVPSVVFGYAYEKTQNIAVPALAHGLYNATLFTLMYIAVTYAPEEVSFLGL